MVRLRRRCGNVQRLLCLRFDVEPCDLEEEVAHFVELVCAFGYGAAGFEADDEVGEGFQVGGVAVEYGVAEDDDEWGEWRLEDGPAGFSSETVRLLGSLTSGCSQTIGLRCP